MRYFFFFVFVLVSTHIFGQRQGRNHNYSTGWEFGIRAGASNYLGELGGRELNAKPYLFFNTEISQFRPCGSLSLTRHIGRLVNIKGNFSYLRIKGSDELTENPEKRNRNLNFFSNVYELSVQAEIFAKRNTAAKMSLALRRYNSFWKQMGISFTAGIGGYHFNPKTNYEGETIKLRPLGTEGQGIAGNPDPYSLFSISLPLGLNVYYSISPTTSLHFLISHRFLFTDYLDDVSTLYFNAETLAAENGEMAATLADRSPQDVEERLPWTTEGAIRGNPESDDSFFSIEFGITQQITRNPRSGFNKKSPFRKKRRKLKRKKVRF